MSLQLPLVCSLEVAVLAVVLGLPGADMEHAEPLGMGQKGISHPRIHGGGFHELALPSCVRGWGSDWTVMLYDLLCFGQSSGVSRCSQISACVIARGVLSQ